MTTGEIFCYAIHDYEDGKKLVLDISIAHPLLLAISSKESPQQKERKKKDRNYFSMCHKSRIQLFSSNSFRSLWPLENDDRRIVGGVFKVFSFSTYNYDWPIGYSNNIGNKKSQFVFSLIRLY